MKTKKIKRKIRATVGDEFLSIVMEALSSIPLITVFELDGRIDVDVLKKAFKYLLDDKYLLQYKFVKGFFKCYWQKIDNLDLDDLFIFHPLKKEETLNRVIHNYIYKEEFDCTRHAQVKCYLVRDNEDHLIIKLSHEAMDAGSAKHIFYQLTETYNKLIKNSTYEPPKIEYYERSLNVILRKFTLAEKFKILKAGFNEMKNRPKDFYTYPFLDAQLKSPLFERREVAKASKMIDFCKVNNVNTNVLLMTSVLRAVMNLNNQNPKSYLLNYNIDLRIYLRSIRNTLLANLVSIDSIAIKENQNGSFISTMNEVYQQLTWSKENYAGLRSLPSTLIAKIIPYSLNHRLFNALFEKQKFPITYSNLGNFDAVKLSFCEIKTKEFKVIPPTYRPPMFFICSYEFNDSIMLGFPYYEKTISHEEIDKLFKSVSNELSALCNV
jgi:NRPS condensation-like uncharacterized protein